MKAMVLTAPGHPLAMETRPDPQPAPGEIVVRVEACAVCRTDLHVVDG
jgi:propanol-preferring alcohol dehydrogenase